MKNKIISSDSKKYLGIVFIIAAVSELLYKLFLILLYDSSSLDTVSFFYMISYMPLIIMGLSFIIPEFKKKTLKLVQCSLIAFSIFKLIIVFLPNNKGTFINNIVVIFELIIYIIIGIIPIINMKHIKICTVLTFILITLGLCHNLFDLFESISGTSLFFYSIPFYSTRCGIVTLSLLFIYFLSFADENKKSRSQIEINTDIIDFKLMLELIEEQYKSGSITEDEYKIKRNEILKQL